MYPNLEPMKMMLKPTLLLFLFMVSILSCNNEELFVEPTADVVNPDVPVDTDTPAEDTNAGTVDTSLPCSFTLDTVQTGDTVVINCVMDLGGQTINLPANVTIVYEGGDIINGTLNFASNTVISGELLNSSLTLSGTSPQMKDTTFNFDPQRWGIVEGETTSEIALKNRDILEDLFIKTKEMGTTTFSIDKMDAYFEVSLVTSGTTNQNFYASTEAINIPSDFNLEMSDNTFLRVQPNNRKTYALIAVFDETNITIKGGNLYGDRDDHDYSDGTSHEWGYILFLRGAREINISNVVMKNGTGDGMKIQSLGFVFDPDYIASENIYVNQCVFDNNRRNNMSITGGEFIYIDQNQFLNASNDTNKSEGVAPGFAIDIEATRKRDDVSGELIYYERADNIFITNNTEKNSRAGGFTVAIGYDVTIENNNVESGISFSLANGVKILNNILNASEKDRYTDTGIKAGRTNADDETIYNNLVSGNTINGFGTGIMVSNRDVVISENNINDCMIGITLIKLTDAKINYNKIDSTQDGSLGITIGQTSANNVSISNNEISVIRNPLKFNKTNSETIEFQNYIVNVSNNKLANNDQSSSLINGSYGFVFNNNTLDHGYEIFNSHNISFFENTINTQNDHGFDIRLVNTGILLSKNNITVSDKKQCVNIDSTTNASEVTIVNNSCL